MIYFVSSTGLTELQSWAQSSAQMGKKPGCPQGGDAGVSSELPDLGRCISALVGHEEVAEKQPTEGWLAKSAAAGVEGMEGGARVLVGGNRLLRPLSTH